MRPMSSTEEQSQDISNVHVAELGNVLLYNIQMTMLFT